MNPDDRTRLINETFGALFGPEPQTLEDQLNGLPATDDGDHWTHDLMQQIANDSKENDR